MIPGLPNFRDVGGMPLSRGGQVRTGVLYRSAAPAALTTEGVDAFDASPLGTAIDLRTPAERASAPNRLPARIRTRELPLLEGAMAEMAERAMSAAAEDREAVITQALAHLPTLGGLYTGMLTHGAATFAEIARLVADGDDSSASAVLVHCTAGKDRTGVSIALLLDAVGADRDAIIADYALSSSQLAGAWADGMRAMVARMGMPMTPAVDELVTGAPPAALAEAFTAIDTAGGSAAYLRSGGLTEDEGERLRTRLTA